MKRKSLSLLVSLSLVLSAGFVCNMPLSVQASAETSSESTSDDAWKSNVGTITLGSSISVSGEGVSVSGSTINITKGGDFTVSGTLTNGSINVDTTEKVKLRLSNASITNASGPAICFTNAKKAFITLEDGTTNTLSDGSNYSSNADAKGTLFSNDTLEIKGNGTLNVKGNYKHAIVSDDDIIISNGNINITGAVKDGIHANDNITFDGGNVSVVSTKDGIDSEGDIIVNDGSITISAGDDGMHADTDLTINGGSINVTNSYEAVESKANLTINGGTVECVASDDGLNAARNITINDGYLYCKCGADGIDSNGTININGGVIVSYGGRVPECGIDCDNNTLTITGGFMFASGGDNSSVSSNTSTQNVVTLGGSSANTAYHIEKDGTDILTIVPEKESQNITFTAPTLETNSSYTVYTGGSVAGGTNFHGLYTGGTYSNGTQSTTFTVSSVVTNAGGTSGGMGGPGGQTFPGGPGGQTFPGRPGGPGGWNPWNSSTNNSGSMTAPSAPTNPWETPDSDSTDDNTGNNTEDNNTGSSTEENTGSSAGSETDGGSAEVTSDAKINVVVINNSNEVSNTLAKDFKVTVSDDGQYDLSKLKIRYYLTNESGVDQTFYCDNANIQYNSAPWYVSCNSAVKSKVVSLDNAVNGADCYLELGFDSDAVLNSTGTLTVSGRLVNSYWIDYNQSNDLSYTSGVAVYYDGVLISGPQLY